MNLISRNKLKNFSFYVFVILFSILLPIILNMHALSAFVGATYGENSKMFEFFGLSGFLVTIAVVAWTIKQNHPSDLFGYLKIFLPAVVALVWLSFISDHTQKSWDYLCYERAAQSLLNGKNPYLDCYFYPPFVLSIFSWSYTTIQYIITEISGFPLQYEKAWIWVFYLYQCVQWFMVILAFMLSNRLADKFGLQKNLSLGIVTLLFILNNPLMRTLSFNQVNFWVLDIILLIFLLNTTHPFIAGLMAALGTHIKLYPALFIAPWIWMKDRKALSGFVVGTITLLAFTFIPPGNISTWLQFINNILTHQAGDALRDNSLHSLLFNILRVTTMIQPWDVKSKILGILTAAVSFLAGIWFLVRLVARYKILRRERGFVSEDSFERYGLLVDVVGFLLLISPIVWEHQYVLAIPVMLWTFAHQIRKSQLPIASLLAFLFIFGLPTFDVFPFSYLRLSGLLILLIKSDPILAVDRSSKINVTQTPSPSSEIGK